MLFCFRVLFVTLTLFSVSLSVRSEPIDKSEIRVIDGDTIDARGHRWRMLGYDTPEVRSTWRKVSPVEKMVGRAAKERFQELLKSGQLNLTEKPCSCPAGKLGTKACNHGRKCGVLTRDGKNIGAQLIEEKLAVEFVCGETKCPRMPRWDEFISRHQHPPER